MADTPEPCAGGECGEMAPSLGFWLVAGGAVLVLVGLDLLTGGKVLSWLPIPALFGSATPAEVKDSAGD